jgi:hypothetical protein
VPSTTILVAKQRVALGGTTVLAGTYMDMTRCLADQHQGYYTAPFLLSDVIDVSYPIDIFVWYRSPLTGPPGSYNIVIHLGMTTLEIPDVIGDNLITNTIPVPSDWQTTDVKRTLIDSGSGHTYDAGTLFQRDMLGWRMTREGNNANDTYQSSVDFVNALEVVGHLRCNTCRGF